MSSTDLRFRVVNDLTRADGSDLYFLCYLILAPLPFSKIVHASPPCGAGSRRLRRLRTCKGSSKWPRTKNTTALCLHAHAPTPPPPSATRPLHRLAQNLTSSISLPPLRDQVFGRDESSEQRVMEKVCRRRGGPRSTGWCTPAPYQQPAIRLSTPSGQLPIRRAQALERGSRVRGRRKNWGCDGAHQGQSMTWGGSLLLVLRLFSSKTLPRSRCRGAVAFHLALAQPCPNTTGRQHLLPDTDHHHRPGCNWHPQVPTFALLLEYSCPSSRPASVPDSDPPRSELIALSSCSCSKCKATDLDLGSGSQRQSCHCPCPALHCAALSHFAALSA